MEALVAGIEGEAGVGGQGSVDLILAAAGGVAE